MNQGLLGNPSLAVRDAVSQVLTAIPSNPLPGAGLHFSVEHGLGVTPHKVDWVLVCLSTDGGYAVGDEVDVPGTVNGSIPITTWRNATAVGIAVDVNRTLTVHTKNTNTQTTLAAAKWAFKAYVSLHRH